MCADVRKPDVDWALMRRLADQWREVADCFLGDFYPLSAYQLDEELWLAWQFDLPEQERGMIQVFRRAQSHYESARFRLHGLDANARYTVTDLDHPDRSQTITGAELMEKGLRAESSMQPEALVFAYRKMPSGRQ
jgi:alpha-galactosidase